MCDKIQKAKSFIPLGIALAYPVEWEFDKILRDLIQNFYDSVGKDRFAKEFFYRCGINEDGTLTLDIRTSGHPFSYEWLTCIGASTKTGDDSYAGEYGEGFKICMLCLYKRGLQVWMESQDWRLSPCEYQTNVGGVPTPMLGYNIAERTDDGWTVLTIRGIPSAYKTMIEEGLLEFFYPENPLFGKKIAAGKGFELYERSDMPVPCADGTRIEGILYYKYMARGRIPFPVIVHALTGDVLDDTRERQTWVDCRVNEVLYNISLNMDAITSYHLLEKMEKYWDDLPRKRTTDIIFDVDTWFYLICRLVRNISTDPACTAQFQKKYNGLVYLDRTGSDPVKNNAIRKAKEWHREKNDNRRIVSPIFRLLGVPSLLGEYEKMIASMYRQPEGCEDEMAELLYEAAGTISGIKEPYPRILIANDPKAGVGAMSFARRQYGKKSVRYQIEKAVFRPEEFAYGNFTQCFIKYMDIFLHRYGMDRSEKLNGKLTFLGMLLLKYGLYLENVSARWNSICKEHGLIEKEKIR